jgi:hypothetical protein
MSVILFPEFLGLPIRMGLPPPNYNKVSLLPEPVAKKTVLPVQGGGACSYGLGTGEASACILGTGEASARTPLESSSRKQKGGFVPLDTKELIIQCNANKEKLHYVINGKIENPVEGVREIVDANFEGIEQKSIQYSWVLDEDCFNLAAVQLLNHVGDYMKEGGIVAFVDYGDDMLDKIELITKFINDMENKYERLANNWDISVIRASEFPFILGFTDANGNARIPDVLMLFTLLGGAPPPPPPSTPPSTPQEASPEEQTEVKEELTESTIKLTVGFRVRNPETVKDKIRELSFTPGEELLFKRLGFDKPFIRKYITLPDGTKEESDASKDAFFKFWKTYVVMDGTSQFSLMTKKESQEVQQYMRDILDAYRKYLSESALQLLFHTSGKPYEPVSEGVSEDSFVFTKILTPTATNHKKISAAVKVVIEAVAATKELDVKAHRISIAKAKTLTTAKATYNDLKKDIETIIVEAKKAIDAAKEASLDTGEGFANLAELEGFKFTETDDLDDYVKAGNDLISLANKLIKKLEALEEAARKFAIIVELEGDNNDSTYVSENSENEDEDEDAESIDGDAESTEEDISNAESIASLNTVRHPKNPTPPVALELKSLLFAIDKIVKKGQAYNKTISDIIVTLSAALPDDDFGEKLRIFMGNPPKTTALYMDATKPKIAPVTFIRDYLVEKGKHETEPNKRMSWIINSLIKMDLRPLKDVKGDLIKFFKDKVLVRALTGNRIRILKQIDPSATP